MNDGFEINNFEDLLKTQADKHRLYPDDAVWRSINNRLHPKRKWPALTFGAVLTSAILVAGFIFLHPDKTLLDRPIHELVLLEKKFANHNETQSHSIAQKIIDQKNSSLAIPLRAAPNANNFENRGIGFGITDVETESDFYLAPTADVVSLNEPGEKQNILYNSEEKIIAEKNNSNPKTPAHKSENFIAKNTDNQHTGTNSEDDAKILQASNAQNVNGNNTVENGGNDNNSTATTTANTNLNEMANEANQNISDNNFSTQQIIASNKPVVKKIKEKVEHPFSISGFVTPSISYRTLSVDPAYDYHYPYNTAITGNPRNDVNNYVNQKPAIGYEIGVSFAYALSNKFRLKAGAQFNYRQYNINAFFTSAQQATILLNRGLYADSISTFSNYRTAGLSAVQLQNYSYQLSMPIGFEYTAIQGKKLSIDFGASIQPTYQFNNDMFLVSSDYKAYTIQPDLARRWNINAGLEILARFKAGGLTWQVGPQLRYQMLPTQISSYTIHENLLDYGLKIGVVKTFK